MWEPEFANRKRWALEKERTEGFVSRVKQEDVEAVQLLYWREHCLECSPPDCYHSCHLYEKRRDKRCVRVKYGIYPNRDISGFLGFGADVRFKKWAKLGSSLYPAVLAPDRLKKFQDFDLRTSKMVNGLFRFTNPFNPLDWFKVKFHNPQRQLFKLHTIIRENLLQRMPVTQDKQPDCFLIECFSFEKEPFNLIIEHNNNPFFYRDSVRVCYGHNLFEIEADRFSKGAIPKGSITVYPENDLEARVVFTWLDFVKKRKASVVVGSQEKPAEKPAQKVKCVAWDLDNTMWNGVLIDKGKDNITIPREHLEIIRKLDERGIIQTVVSKNDHSEAWSVIERHGLGDYFIYPAINWAPKSSNLRQIARRININLDTFALIDDSTFERAEVQASLPQVRLYSEREIVRILGYSEFDVPVTEASRNRRKSYLLQVQREKVQEQYSGDYKAFLKDCQMHLRIFIPRQQKHVKRCLELVQRSNQLNLSTKRYTEEEFGELLGTEGMLCLALHCSDRFGDYGIVGFASVDERGEIPRLKDFVISCRVAQKMVEHTFMEWLGAKEKGKGFSMLEASLIRTKKNGPLVKVFDEMPFEKMEDGGEAILYRLGFDKLGRFDDVMMVTDEEEQITA
ncbi:MAG: HAD-IIIC family phosphatase [Chitinispirillaceae bacterium]